MSKSASLPAEPFENSPQTTAAWKQEVNQRLAAHRNRRGGHDASVDHDGQNARPANGRAAEAAARVAARYAKAPSYSEILAGEARAAVRAAAEAAEAALNAHAAAQAVLDGLENRPLPPHLWQPVDSEATRHETEQHEAAHYESPRHESAQRDTRFEPEAYAAPASSRWQDEPAVAEEAAAALSVTAASVSETQRPWPGAQPRWEEGLTPPAPQDVWAEMRVHRAPEPERYGTDSRTESRMDSRMDSRVASRNEPRIDARIYDPRIDPRIYAPRIHGRARDSEAAVQDQGEEAELFETGAHMIEPVELSHANLIEFPRELVAARKARPRLAEGPLYNPVEEGQQLNIFESIPEVASHGASHDKDAVAIEPPGWASIELDHPVLPAWHKEHAEAYAHPPQMLDTAYVSEPQFGPAHYGYEAASYQESHFEAESYAAVQAEPALRPMARETGVRENPLRAAAVRAEAPPEMLVATVSDRILAGLVDGALVTLAFLAAAVVVIASTAHPPGGRMALIAMGCGLLLFGILYQFLFLSFAEEGTPGMRYARIALCTFEDDNPTIAQMQMRIPALLLATAPAGIGLLWSLWDKDQIGWHDRWTRTYQRKY